MRRRHFLTGLGSASAGSAMLFGTGVGQKGGPPKDHESPESPVRNVNTETTYESIGPAVEEAAPGHTLSVELGAGFEEDVTIDTDDLTLEAKGNSRLRFNLHSEIETHEVNGNSQPTFDDDIDVLILETKGNADPIIESDLEQLVLEAKGNTAPTIEGDVEQLMIETRGNAEPTIDGDVGRLVLDSRGNSESRINGDVDESIYGSWNTQPTIEGELEIEANGVTVTGFNIVANTVGIDVLADDPETVQLSNNVVSGATSDEDSSSPEDGVGIRIQTEAAPEPISIGGENGSNFLEENEVGVAVVDENGGVTDIDTLPLFVNNLFVRNDAIVLPEPGDPKDEPDPIVSPGPPVEVITSERDSGDTITAELPGVTVDEDESIGVLSMSVRLESEANIEFTFDPEQQVDDPALVEGYDAIDDGGFTIDTPLNAEEIEAARFTFSVERDTVDDPEQFSVHRRVDGEFEPLRTDLVSKTSDTYQYAVLSPGFSLFQATEFDVGGIGGSGRKIDGELILPEDDPVDGTFVRVETTESIDNFEVEARDATVEIDDSIVVDLEDIDAAELPETFFDLFRITNTGDEPATVRTSAGLSRATFLSVPLEDDFDEIDLPLGISFGDLWSVLPGLADIGSDPIELYPGETVSLALDISSVDPDNQLWVTLGVPTFTKAETGEPHLGSEEGGALNNIINCGNEADAPIMYHREFSDGNEDWIPDSANLDNPHLRVPAYLNVNWLGDSLDRGNESIAVVIEMNNGPDGSLIGIYDKNGVIGGEESLHPNPIAQPYSAEDFADGAETVEFDLIFESTNDCDPPTGFDSGIIDGIIPENDNIGDLEINVLFHGDDNRWAEISGDDEVNTTAEYYTLGRETADEIVGDLLEESFQTFNEGVLSAAMPGPVQTYRVARAATGAGSGNLDLVAMWSGVDTLTRDTALTPSSLLAEQISEGITGFSGGNGDEIQAPTSFDQQDLDIGLFGPSIYVSDAPEPNCVEPNVRTLTVEGQVTGGPVVLMGLDSELQPGSSNHGPPEEHAAMVESILDSVTNGGEGILVLGGNPENNSDIVEYWGDDIAEDPRIDEEVTFVNGAEDIRDVDMEGYAMIGIVSSTYQISYGLSNSENEALGDRQGDIAAFINGGGGLLGKTQDGLTNPWKYISPVADIDSIHANNSSVEVTNAGEELGLTQNGMDGWCCYHEAFEEESVPEFLDVLLRNPEQSADPPSAIGGDEVVVETAVELEITGPANVVAGEPTEFEFSLQNAADEAGEDIRLDVEFTRFDEIESGDVELANGSELELEDDALRGTLTEEPIEFPPDLDEEFIREITFNDTGGFNIQVDVVGDDSGRSVVRLPFGIRSISEEQGLCED